MNAPATMRELGQVKSPPLIRFGRNQRRAALVAVGFGRPKGVQLFRTWSEVESWEKKRRTS